MAGYILDMRVPACQRIQPERVIAEGILDTGDSFVTLHWVISRDDLSKVKGVLCPPPREGRQSIPSSSTPSGSLVCPVGGTKLVRFASSVGEELAGRCAAALYAALSEEAQEGRP